MVENSLFAINDLLQGANVSFVLYMVCGDDFHKKFQILGKFFFHFVLFHLIFPCYYCSIDLKRQSEQSGPRLDTSSPVIIVIIIMTIMTIFIFIMIIIIIIMIIIIIIMIIIIIVIMIIFMISSRFRAGGGADAFPPTLRDSTPIDRKGPPFVLF